MKRFSHKLVRLLVATLLLLFLLFGAIAYFMVTSKAPVLFGEVNLHVIYKDELAMDVYFPTRQVYDQSPVILYFHGGAWIGGSKAIINANRFNDAVNTLREKGYTFVCPDYTLARQGQPPFPKSIQDAHAALRWIETNAAKHNIDLNNVGVIGESAGAHIAMMMTFADAQIVDEAPTIIKIRYLIDVYGPSNLHGIYHMPTLDSLNKILNQFPESIQNHLDIAELMFGFDPKKDTLRANLYMDQYSPVNYVSNKTPPVLMIHGDNDHIVPFGQSVELEKILKNNSVKHDLIKLSHVDHAFRGITDEQKAGFQQVMIRFVSDHYQDTLNNL